MNYTQEEQNKMTIEAEKVKKTIGNYMLADGFDIIFDLKKSSGSYVVDARDGKRYLDFFTCFATSTGRHIRYHRFTS